MSSPFRGRSPTSQRRHQQLSLLENQSDHNVLAPSVIPNEKIPLSAPFAKHTLQVAQHSQQNPTGRYEWYSATINEEDNTHRAITPSHLSPRGFTPSILSPAAPIASSRATQNLEYHYPTLNATIPSSQTKSSSLPSKYTLDIHRPKSSSPKRDYLGSPAIKPLRPFSPGNSPTQQRRPSYTGETTLNPSLEKRPLSNYSDTEPDAELDFEKQKEFQDKLDKVLSNKQSFLKSSEASFVQFDKDGNHRLDFYEVKTLMEKLIRNLQLPPLDDKMLFKIFQKYDNEGDHFLNLSEFQTMYWELLHTIKEKFYPTRTMKVRRSSFVSQTELQGTHDIQKLFSFEKRLGAGSFGEVFLVKEKSSSFERVCKVINKDLTKIPMEQIEAEIDVLKRLDHPNIIKVFEVYQDAQSIYIIMEICDGGELAERITKTFDNGYILSESYVADVMRQLLEAVNYFHTKRVAHKDLKPENILFQSQAPDSPIKVIDFGLAEMFERQTEFSKNAAGTYLYMAPEVLDYIVTFKCDIWSMGCILFQLLTGEVPFPGITLEEVEHKLRYTDPPYEKFNGLPVSQLAIDLVQKMLTRDFSSRPTAQECLNHPWMVTVRNTEIQLPKEMCYNLKRYRRQPNLKNVLTNLLAHQLNVTGTQIRDINAVFRALDKDGDGHLSKKELAFGLGRVGFPPHEISQIIHALDIDGSAACYTWRESELNVVWTAFNKMDRDGDGKITIDEFIECLTGQGTKSSDSVIHTRIATNKDQLRRMAQELDQNGDGIIDWKEFLAYMKA